MLGMFDNWPQFDGNQVLGLVKYVKVRVQFNVQVVELLDMLITPCMADGSPTSNDRDWRICVY